MLVLDFQQCDLPPLGMVKRFVGAKAVSELNHLPLIMNPLTPFVMNIRPDIKNSTLLRVVLMRGGKCVPGSES